VINGNAEEYISQKKALIEEALADFMDCYCKEKGHDSRLAEAMRYSLLASSKRIRPMFVLAAAQAVGGGHLQALPAACAIEMIHTYSLIHDDLPAMDNDDLRRGKPTNHRVFGDATAILAGDALLTLAFALLADEKHNHAIAPETRLAVIAVIAEAAGIKGMAGGQMLDILAEGGVGVAEELLEEIHIRKTAMLIAASLKVGGLLARANSEQLSALQEYGSKIGLAFQIADDVLDIEGSPLILGKEVGADEKRGKLTYPALYGVDKSRQQVALLIELAIEAIAAFDEKADALRMLARYIGTRKK